MRPRNQLVEEARAELLRRVQEVIDAVQSSPLEDREAVLRAACGDFCTAMFEQLDRSAPDYLERAAVLLEASVGISLDMAALAAKVGARVTGGADR